MPRTATPADRAQVVATIVAAFANDPTFRYFFPDEARFDDYAAAFAGYLFDARVERGEVWVVEAAAAAALWDSPALVGASAAGNAPEPSGTTDIGRGLDLPRDVLARLDRYDELVAEHLPSTPHWYLGVLATHPAHAGRRLGRHVMSVGLARAAADGVPAYLETANPRNVDLYRRAGWEVSAHLRTGGLDVWVMRHSGVDISQATRVGA